MATLIERHDMQPELCQPAHNLLRAPERRARLAPWILRMPLSCPSSTKKDSCEKLEAEQKEMRSQRTSTLLRISQSWHWQQGLGSRPQRPRPPPPRQQVMPGAAHCRAGRPSGETRDVPAAAQLAQRAREADA
eukprot:6763566-Pyramimonas_sp.AAC.1